MFMGEPPVPMNGQSPVAAQEQPRLLPVSCVPCPASLPLILACIHHQLPQINQYSPSMLLFLVATSFAIHVIPFDGFCFFEGLHDSEVSANISSHKWYSYRERRDR